MIRSIRDRLVQRSPILLITLCIFTFAACDDPMNVRRPKAKAYDGKDYFKGIMFGVGAYAQEIPEIRDNYSTAARGLTATEVQEVDEKIVEIIDLVDSYDSKFFDSFERDIESGDHLRVEKAIQQGGFALVLAMLETKEGEELFEQLQDREKVEELIAEINAEGGFGELSADDFEAAMQDLKLVRAEETGVGSAQGKCIYLPVFFVAAIAIFVVAIAAVALALAAALYLWVAVAAQVAIAVDIAIFFTRHLWFASFQPIAALQVEGMIDSIAVRG